MARDPRADRTSVPDRTDPSDRSGMETVFEGLMRAGTWHSTESLSGTGSSLAQTAALRRALPQLLARLKIRTLLDIPCGDVHWMSRVELPIDLYIGADVVGSLVEANRSRWAREARGGTTRRFERLDVTRDELPRVDLILCRDCLVHFAYADAWRALERFRESGSTWLLTTHFRARRFNRDIPTGEWRTLDLVLPPFSFPAPLDLLDEQCTEGEGRYADKSLALWRIADLPAQACADPRE